MHTLWLLGRQTNSAAPAPHCPAHPHPPHCYILPKSGGSSGCLKPLAYPRHLQANPKSCTATHSPPATHSCWSTLCPGLLAYQTRSPCLLRSKPHPAHCSKHPDSSSVGHTANSTPASPTYPPENTPVPKNTTIAECANP